MANDKVSLWGKFLQFGRKPASGEMLVGSSDGEFDLVDVGISNSSGTIVINKPLTVEGQVESTTGGFKFPDDTVQTTAANNIGTSQVDFISGVIPALANQDYKLVVKIPYAITITETTTICTSGTATGTFKIDGVALGGTANSISSSEQSQTHSSSNSAAAGTDITLTISSNSSCLFLSFTIKFTRTLA